MNVSGLVLLILFLCVEVALTNYFSRRSRRNPEGGNP